MEVFKREQYIQNQMNKGCDYVLNIDYTRTVITILMEI